MDVGAEDQLLEGDVAELVDQLVVAGPIDDPLVLPARKGVGPGSRHQEAALLGDLGDGVPQHPQLLARAAHVRARGGRHLQHRLQQLGLHLALQLRRDRGEDRLDLVREVEAVGVEEHQFLLDPDRERGAVEVVFEHLNAVTARCQGARGRAYYQWPSRWRQGPRGRGGAVGVRSVDTPECQTLRVKHSGDSRRPGPRHPRPVDTPAVGPDPDGPAPAG